jgi:hypothetical protein
MIVIVMPKAEEIAHGAPEHVSWISNTMIDHDTLCNIMFT